MLLERDLHVLHTACSSPGPNDVSPTWCSTFSVFFLVDRKVGPAGAIFFSKLSEKVYYGVFAAF